MCFGAFFYVPELKDRTYLDDAYRRFVGAGGEIFPLKPPKTPIVKLQGNKLANSYYMLQSFKLYIVELFRKVMTINHNFCCNCRKVQQDTKTQTPTQLNIKVEKSPTPSDHKELMAKIQKEKEEFLMKKKKEEEEKKQKELEKLIHATKEPGKVDVGKAISGGEPSDPITKKRRNFVKKVKIYHKLTT